MKINLANKSENEILKEFLNICKYGSSKDSRIFVSEAKQHGITYEQLCEYKKNHGG